MKISSRDPEKAQPHHGLLILGIGAVIASLFSSLPEGLLSFTSEKVKIHGGCMYQLFVDDTCRGIAILEGPETLDVIARAFRYNDGPKEDRKIPCNTAVRISSQPSRYSLERIPGAYLIMAGQKIDINCADVPDLQAVPGIGPVLADRLVSYRQRQGPFREVAELTGMGGISRRRLQALAPYLRAGSSRCDTPQDIETVGRFVNPSIRGYQKELPGSNEIGKSNGHAH